MDISENLTPAQAVASLCGTLWMPDHLWEAVLLRLRPPDVKDIRMFSSEDCQAVMRAQAEYAQLRLVCKQYNNIYEKPCSLSLFKDCAGDSLDSLLQWLEGCKESLQVIEAICSRECVERLLEVVTTSTCRLRILDVSAISNRSVQLMAQCRLLTACGLSCPIWDTASSFDLLPLQALPCLSKLVLQKGDFINLHVLAHLTTLHLNWCDVDCPEDSMCVSTLQILELQGSSVEMHHCGLSAFHGLRSLSSVHSGLLSDLYEDMLICSSAHRFQVPVNISALTCLTQLTMHVPGADQVDIHWLSKLKALRDLVLLLPSSNAALLAVTSSLLDSESTTHHLTRLQIVMEA